MADAHLTGASSPRIALAYDQETGFGLLQALAALGLPALEFGDGAAPASATLSSWRMASASSWRPGSSQSRNSPATGNICSTRRSSPRPPIRPGAAPRSIDADGKLLGIGSLRLQMSQNGEVADINMIVPINLLAADPR